MALLPTELLEDVLQPLDRWTLDGVQFTDGRFLHLITEHMSEVCLRKIGVALFQAPNENDNTAGTSLITMDGRPGRRNVHKNTAELFAEFVQALRSSRVAYLSLTGLVFTPELVALLLQAPIVAAELSLHDGSFAEVTPAQFQKVLLHFSPTSLDIFGCSLRACQISDGLLRALSKNRVQYIQFPNMVPVDGVSFHVTDDAIVELCVQEDVPICQEEEEDGPKQKYEELELYNGSFTKHLFKRLVEASAVSTRTQPLLIAVSTRTQPLLIAVLPVHCEEEDLREFAQHLSYRYRGLPWQERVYDFPGEQQGAAATMDLQIVLDAQGKLEVYRARRPNPLLLESDE